MADEIHASVTELPVEILGVNRKDAAGANDVATAGREIPWIQDTDEADVWTALGISYRDVVVLDATGGIAGVYNLTAHDLGNPDYFATLKQMIVDASKTVDINKNCVPDSWESNATGGLMDEISGALREQYLFGGTAGSASELERNDAGEIILSYRRLAGNPGVQYQVEASPDGENWNETAPDLLQSEATGTLNYDGSGTETVVGKVSTTVSEMLFRVRAVLECAN